MITGFDHVVIAVRDLTAGVAAYEGLLGRGVVESDVRDGVARALIATDNIAVEVMAPEGESTGAQPLRAALEHGDGLKSLVFATGDIARAHRRAERVGLEPEAVSDSGAFRLNTVRTHGVRLFLMQRRALLQPTPAGDAAVIGLDHIVIRTPDAERAAALYGARLGLDMRLDREVAGRRLMFFRCGDAILEIAHDASLVDGRDQFWGLSWRVADAAAAQARLAASGLSVSDVRAGLKPGTRVVTVRDGTCGVPTLLIEKPPRS